ncbi:VCBS domain-containing protein [Aeromonas media]|uniref:VCBS domain-containing protein n=3 Tax=Aeromonas TaxID=642 RepID=UPI0019146C71|nr:VCBS domain-containing protein [Aeromonas media]QQQ15521.1 VCBS domain-containing protein [Aeromonas media]
MKKHTPANAVRFRRKPLISALEPRILLDGAAVATAVEMTTDVAFQEAATHTASAEQSMHFAAPAPTASEPGNRREVAFVDTSVDNYQDLVDGLDDGVEVILIDSSENGLEQMVAALQGQSGIDAIHLFSHGDVGELKLGTLTLNGENLDANAQLLAALGETLTESGDLMLYGCYVGSDSEGQGFLDAVAQLTSADVAAFEDLTGAQALGGDWELEVTSGSVETTALVAAGYDGTLAPLVISNLDDLQYSEGDGAVRIDGDVTIGGGTDYTGGYIDFEIGGATSSESLGFISDSTPSTVNGEVSIVGSTVYRGNGSVAIVIGSVDLVKNGENGQPLRINFSNAFENGDFQDGTNGSTVISGWTSVMQRLRMGVDQIAGQLTPVDPTYPASNGSVGDNTTGGNFVQSAKLSNYAGSDASDLAIELDTGAASFNQSYGVIRGPAVYSDGAVALQAGDKVSFDWKALSGGDAYDAFGYIIDVNTGETITILDRTGTSSNQETNWAREEITIGAGQEGVYRFVFVAGSYDFTGGNYVGGKLMIDDVKVTQANPPGPVGDSVLTSLAQRITYENTAVDYNTLTRTVTVSVMDKAGNTGSDTSQVTIAERNNAPSFSGNATLGAVNEDTTAPAGSSIGTLFGSLFSDVDASFDPKDSLAGIIITGDASDSSQGEWQYSTDGTNWLAVGTVSADAGLLLSSTASLRFVPAADYNGAPGSLSVHAVDSSDPGITFTSGATRQAFDTTAVGSTGGTAAVSAVAVSLGTSITAVNDIPVIDNSTGTVTGASEDTARTITYAELQALANASDKEDASVSFRIESILSGTLRRDSGGVLSDVVAGTTLLAPGESLIWLPDSNANGVLSAFTVKAVDSQNGVSAASLQVNVQVAAVNDPVSITGKSSVTLNEDSSILINGFALTDVEGDNVTVRISSNHGNLTLDNPGSVSVSQSGGHTLVFSGAIGDVQAALNSLRYAGDADYFGSDQLTIEASDDSGSSWQPYRVDEQGLFYNPANGHYYEYVSAPGMTWADAKAAAESRELFGLKGYLATVTSAEENAFITPKLGGDGWMGASDAAIEGQWRWVTGPEAGTLFWTGTGSGSSVDGNYENWGDGEPNNAGEEDYAHFISSNGKWNDYAFNNGAISGYIVEYGGAGFGNLEAASLDITINAVNDTPVITGVDTDGAINDSGTLTDTGSITFADADPSDRPAATETTKSVTAKRADGTTNLPLTTEQLAAIENAFSISAAAGNDNNGTVNWVYDIKASDLEFLAEGEVVTAVFTITVDDDNGGTATQDVTVTLTGSNDVPEISVVDVTGEITDGSSDLTDSGSISFTDVDLTDRPTASEVTKSVTAKKADGTALLLTTEQLAAIENAFSISPAEGNDNDGTINWTYDIDAGDLEFLAEGEVVTAVFTITVDDGQGGTATQDVTVTLTGSNDVPEISVGDVAGEITDGSSDLTDSGSISFSDVDLTDRPTASEVIKSVTAKKADGTTNLPLTTEQLAAIENAFSISAAAGNDNNGTVNWVYDIKASDLEFLAEGEVVTAVFTITVDDDNGGTATQDVTVTLTGSNDVPEISVVDVTGEITDGSSDLTDSGSISFTDVDLTDRPTASEVTKSVTAKKADGTALLLTTEQLAAIENAFSISPAEGNDNDGTINWTYDIDAGDLEFLAEGEVVTAVFTITVDDGQGGTATQDVTVTLTGSNDVPEISVGDVAGEITDGSSDLTDSGSISFSDVDLTDRPTASEVIKSVTAKKADGTTNLPLTTEQLAAIENAFSISAAAGNDNNGTVNWVYDIKASDLEFLAEGEVVTAVFTITVDDDNGGTATQDVTVTLTGSNDVPEISVVDVTGEITDGSSDLTDSGSISFTDVDLTDRPTASEVTKSVTAKKADGTALLLTTEQLAAIENAFSISPAEGNDNDGTINWTYDIDAGDLEFLAEGEVVTAVFTITVDDGQGGTATQDVTVTLTGSNDVPEISVGDVAGEITDGSSDLTDSGSISFSDVDLTDRPTASEVIKSVTAKKADGTTNLPLTTEQLAAIENAFSISAAAGNDNNGTVNWVYDIKASDLEFLAEGEVVTAVFTITVDDDNGGTATQDVTVTLTGSNDVPEISVVDVTGEITDGSSDLTDSGSISFTDVDLTDRPTASEVTKSVTAKKADGTALLLTTEQLAAIENAFSISPAEGNDNDGTINWTYDIDAGDLEFLAEGEVVTAVFTITVDDGQGGTATQDVTVTLTGSNDVPEISVGDVAGEITDGSSDLTDSGSISFSDVDLTDRPTASEVIKSVTAKKADGTTNLPLTTEQLAAIENAFSISAAAGNDNNGTVNWVYDIKASDLEFLAEGEVVTAVFTITVDDDNGGTATQDVTVTLTGSNDVPEISVVDVTGEITDGSSDLTDSGSISFTDVDLTDRPTASEVTKSVTAKKADGTALLLTTEQLAAIENAFSISPAEGNDNDGTINWTYDIDAGDLEFLAEGEVVTAVFTITVDDGQGGTATQDVTVTLTGSNDVPEISVGDVAGEITDGSSDLTDSGSISFSDVDLTDRPTASEVIKSVTAKKADGTTNLPLTTEQLAAIENAFSISAAAGNDNNGTVNWVYDIKASDLEFLAEGEVVTAVFTITVDDDNGGTATQDVTVTLTGSNDVPEISVVDVTGEITDGSSDLTDSGSISFTDVDLTDRPTASEVTKSVTAKKADGTALLLTTEQLAAIENAFSISPAEGNDNDGTINWTYDIDAGDLEFLAEGEVVTAVFTITVDDGQGGTATQDVTVTLTGSNDVPEISVGDVAGEITDGSSDLTDSGSISFSDVDLTDRPTASEVIKSVTAKKADGTTNLPLTTEQLAAIENAFSISAAAGNDNNGTVNWVYDIKASDLEFLAEGEVVTAVFTITVDDDNGGTATQDVTVTLTGSNDVPEISVVDVTGEITDGSSDLTDSGSISFTDVDLTDRPTASEVTKSVTAKKADGTALLLTTEQLAAIENAFSISPAEGNDNDGTINWTYDIDAGDLEFLAEGEVVTAVFTITVDDGQGGTATQDVTVTLTGSNDVPEISVGDVAGEITDGSSDLTDSGSISFSDVDLTDRPTASEVIKSVTAKKADGTTNLPLTTEQLAAIENAFSISAAAGNDNNGTVNWVYDIKASDLEFLAEGEVVTAVFTITVDDDNGGTATQDVTVTLTGSNDVPEISVVDVTGEITDGSSDLTDSGSISFTDVDLTDRPTASEVTKSVTAKKADGTALLLTTEQLAAIENAFSISPAEGNDNDGTINWTYDIDAGDLEFLAEGEVVTAVFTITVDDGQGGTATQDVTVTLTGSNDVPEISVGDVAGEITDGSSDLTDSGSISFSDVDLTDRPTASEVIKSVTAKKADGTTNLPLTTEQLAAIENAFSISAAAGNDNNGTVNWVYDIKASDLEFLAEGEVVTAVFTITVDDDNGGTATQDVTVTLTGSNDVPEISVVDVTGEITDGSSDLTDSGSISFTDVDLTDRPTASEVTKSVTAKKADGTALLLTTEQLAAIENAFSISPAEGNDNDGTINWTYDIDAGDLEFLAEGEVVTAVFTITVDDGQGGTATQDVTVTLTGSNDVPEISVGDVAGEITDGSSDLTDSGSISFSDVDLTDRPTASEVIKSVTAKKADGTTNLPLTTEQLAAIENAFSISAAAGNDNNGTVNWVYDIKASDLEFLAEGEVVTAVFTITVDDDNGGTATQDVTVTLTGSNDVPEISVVDVTGEITDGSSDLTDSGSISFTDVDLTDRPTASEVTKSVTAKKADGTALLLTTEQLAAIENAFSISPAEGNDNDGTINWTYDIDAGDLEFLAEGEVVTAVFTITVDDGQGGTATQDVTVTLTGSNDVPEISVGDVAGEITDGSSDLTDSGSISFSDVDLTDRPTASEVIKSVTAKKADGTTNLPLTTEQLAVIEEAFSISAADGNFNDGTVDWTYDIDAGDLEFLAEGEVVTAVFTITVDDGQGGTATQDVTVTLTGSNDAPQVTVDAPEDFTEAGDAAAQDLVQSGEVHFADVDLTDTINVSFESNDDITWSRADDSVVGTLPAGLAQALVDAFSTGATGLDNEGSIGWTYDVRGLDLDFLNAGDEINFSYTVTVEDSQGATDQAVVNFRILGTNDAPEVTARELSREETTVQLGDRYALEVDSLFSDKDSTLSREDLDFSISGLPRGLVYNPETGSISGSPREPGVFEVQVTAIDAEGATVSRVFELTVTAVPNEAPANPGPGSTPPAAPDSDFQPVELPQSGMPDGLVSESGDTRDPLDSSGFMPSSGLGFESVVEDAIGEGSEPSDDLQGADNGSEDRSEQVILSEPGAIAVQVRNSDGSTTVRASVDVNVNEAGQVEFTQVQQDAFDVVSLVVTSIQSNSEGQVVIAIQDTSTNGGSQRYGGTLSSGEQLPGWIQLDPTTGSVTISNPPAGQKEVSIRVQAIGSDGQIRVLELKLDLEELFKRAAGADAETAEPADVESTGFIPLNDQLAAEIAARDHYGSRLVSMLQSV